MAQQADGTVYVNTLMNTDGIENGAERIQRSLQNAAKTVSAIGSNAQKSAKSVSSAFSQTGNSISQQIAKVESLKQKLAEMSQQKIPTQEYNNVNKEIEKLENSLDKAIEKEIRFTETGGDTDSRVFKIMEYDIEKLNADLDEAKKKKEQLESSGGAYQSVDTSKIEQQLSAEVQELEEMHQKEAQVAAEAARLQEIGNNAEISNQHIVDLNQELETLKTEQSDLEKAGVGLGYKQYDEIISRISEIREELRAYQAELAQTPSLPDQSAPEIGPMGFGESLINGFQMVIDGARELPIVLAGLASQAASAIVDKFKHLPSAILSMAKQGAIALGKTLANGAKKAALAIGGTLLNSIKKTSSAIAGKLIGPILKLTKSFFGLGGAEKKSRSGFAGGLKTILRYGLGVRSLYALINKLRRALVEGFQNLAQFSSSTNSSISSLKSSLTQLKNSFATAFAPILNVVAPILKTFINMISRAATYVGMLIAALTGQNSFVKATEVQEDYAASLGDSADGYKKAGKAQNQYLSGLDEIRRFESPDAGSSDSGSGGYSAPTPGEMFETVPIENSLLNLAERIKAMVQSGDWAGIGTTIADGLNVGLQKVYELINWDNVGPKITPFITGFTDAFNSLVGGLDWTQIGQNIGAGINTITNILNQLVTGINWEQLGASFKNALTGIVTEVDWTALGNTIGEVVMIPWRKLSGFINGTDESGGLDFAMLGTKIAEGLNGLVDSIDLSYIASAISGFVNGVTSSIRTAINDFNWEEFSSDIYDGINTLLTSIDFGEIAGTLSDLLANLLETLISILDNIDWAQIGLDIWDFIANIDWLRLIKDLLHIMWSAISGIVQGALGLFSGIGRSVWTAITNVFSSVGSWFSEKFTAAVNGIKNAFSNVGAFFSRVWSSITGAFGNIANWFREKFSAAWQAVKNVFSKGGEIFLGIKDGILNGLKTVINGLITGINKVIAIPFNGINRALSGIRNISIFGAHPFSWIPSITVPQIPYLATGAVIPPNAPFMAVLGDQRNGNNLEMPENLLRKIIREETGSRSTGNNTYEFVAQLNRRTIFDEIVTEAKLRQSKTGRNPFELA